MNFLTENERLQLLAQHKQERDKRICDRIKAVLLYDKGWSCQQIEDYKRAKKLKPESDGFIERLSDNQSRQLEVHLQEHTYLYVKDIVAYVLSTFNITYTIHGLRNWLQRHGF